ncbi:uncharacterized protein Z518_01627 [Rhinocladiella mackenziei CBS 650.93]|uniref:Uncharacterized protein n=1 Tax=Rhinocladiella mackenziei CBS 650.93 TaxID=1442369 RepID=A0A0D2IX28_9EURO|nr:uncharacterized protein Z518_01627 [Rhinocladiella mackenziei CBS 650.93]KIX10544.1 hypothetical protein Z518_01627 [Rhinocladiella mackenziei CBS 650.93]
MKIVLEDEADVRTSPFSLAYGPPGRMRKSSYDLVVRDTVSDEYVADREGPGDERHDDGSDVTVECEEGADKDNSGGSNHNSKGAGDADEDVRNERRDDESGATITSDEVFGHIMTGGKDTESMMGGIDGTDEATGANQEPEVAMEGGVNVGVVADGSEASSGVTVEAINDSIPATHDNEDPDTIMEENPGAATKERQDPDVEMEENEDSRAVGKRKRRC